MVKNIIYPHLQESALVSDMISTLSVYISIAGTTKMSAPFPTQWCGGTLPAGSRRSIGWL